MNILDRMKLERKITFLVLLGIAVFSLLFTTFFSPGGATVTTVYQNGVEVKPPEPGLEQ